MAPLAIASGGLTNVVGVSAGCGNAHSAPQFDKLHIGTPYEADGKMDYYGHDPKNYGPAMTIIYKFFSGLCARMVDAWSKVPDGDGSLFDHTTIVLMNDSGGGQDPSNPGHHRAPGDLWPVVIVGHAGGALRADGRFLRFGENTHTLADLYCSLATAVGAPTKTFGTGGLDPVKGPIAEITA